MTTDTSSLILHQYEISPFSEKVRVALGIKGLPWHACNQPVIMPKPEMVRLTGGYRRIPVLQIGADLWFDSLYIIEELDRRFPLPPVFANSGVGVVRAFSKWSDESFFMAIVGLLFGDDWSFDEAFVKDRSELIGAPFDPKQMAAAAPALTQDMRRHLNIIETQLADGRPYLTGDRPDALDAAVYCHIAFIRWGKGKSVQRLNECPQLLRWAERVAALGHGQRGDDVDREQAIALATAAKPGEVAAESMLEGFCAGDRVRIKFHDANTPLLAGELMRIDLRGLTIKPTGLECGNLHIHLPHTIATVMQT